MTNTEAKKIAKLLKSGKQYKQGHYQHGYEYFEYDKTNEVFEYKREDYGLDWFNPEITKTTFTEKEFIIKIIEDYDFKDMKNNLI